MGALVTREAPVAITCGGLTDTVGGRGVANLPSTLFSFNNPIESAYPDNTAQARKGCKVFRIR